MDKRDRMFDRMVSDRMRIAVDGAEPSEMCRQRIMNSINGGMALAAVPARKLKTKKFPKVAAAVVLCCLLGGTGVYAVGGMTGIIGSSTEGYNYNEYSQLEKADERIGFDVKAPEYFENGYRFDGMTLINLADTDDSFHLFNKRKGLDITYKNADGDVVDLYIQPVTETTGDPAEHYQQKKEIGGTTVYYALSETLSLPEGQEPTSEQAAREKTDPFFSISYSEETKKAETEYDSSFVFENDGAEYSMLAVNTKMTAEELFFMAAEIINKG